MPRAGRRRFRFLDEHLIEEDVRMGRAHRLAGDPRRRRVEHVGAEVFVERPHELVAEELARVVGSESLPQRPRLRLYPIDRRVHAIHPAPVERATYASHPVAAVRAQEVGFEARGRLAAHHPEIVLRSAATTSGVAVQSCTSLAVRPGATSSSTTPSRVMAMTAMSVNIRVTAWRAVSG